MLTSKLILSLIPLASLVHATTYCNSSSSCPESEPCCSQYGVCGTGANCLGGCHPAYSFSLNACMPMPICKDVSTRFTSFDDVLVYTDYLGNPEDSDWIYSGYIYKQESEEDDEQAILLTMPKESTGTVLSSSRYMWYGKTTATLKTSRGAGVVGSFILFSNAQDEVDWEYVGTNLTAAEMNYYYQGTLDWTNMLEAPVGNSTFENYHTYEIDWTEESITWSLDGIAVRTLNKADTYNSTSGNYAFPQTPSRVQFSLWPAGDSSASGTVEWAGGAVDWDSEDIQEKGYYYLVLKEASIECYDPPKGTTVNGTNAYVFTDFTNYNEAYVAITDDDTVLGSSDASGLNPDEGASSSSSANSESSSSLESLSSGSSASSSSSTSKSSSSSSKSSTSSTKESSSILSTAETTASSTTTSGFIQATTSASSSESASSQEASSSESSSSASTNSTNVANAAVKGSVGSMILGLIVLAVV